MSNIDWDKLARSKSLQAVIDPMDLVGIKNSLIDQIEWNAISSEIVRDKFILDFGCGIGRFAQRLVDKGATYLGLDSSIGMIESAKQLNASNKAEFLHSNSSSLPFPSGHFDVCLSVGVLQYLMHQPGDKEINVFSELARVLSTSGQLLIIEQASASGHSSGTVEFASTESDYINALSEFFIIERIERIRCCTMSRLSSIFLRYGKSFPLKNLVIKFLARLETWKANNANIHYLKNIYYHDIFIKAVKR